MINESKYQKLKKSIDSLERERSEAAGALKQLNKELKKEFGCKNLKEAKKKLEKLKKRQIKYEKLFCEQMEQFKSQFGKLVRAIDEEDKQIHRIARKCIKRAKAGKKSGKKSKKRSS